MFDLALSDLFANARLIAAASDDPLSLLARFGSAPSGTITDAAAARAIQELASAGIDNLRPLSNGTGQALGVALGVTTIGEMANWAPYRAARSIFEFVFNPSLDGERQPGPPADLLPKSGEYPTERVYYNTLILDDIQSSNAPTRDLKTHGPLDLTEIDDQFGFTTPAEGALLSYSQSWYVQGLALGQLLHSLALAPGEATRVAMIDWSRRVSAQRDETADATEQLINTTTHTRSINEVTSAVATEAQSGFSNATSNSKAAQTGGASTGWHDTNAGGFLKTLFTDPFSLVLPGPKLESTSKGTATTNSFAMSFATSSGRRDINAAMAQNVADATHQAAHAARSRRATVVQEVAETEKALATTRVVANYNHMHAMTVSYYEVMQLYRCEVALETVDRCLFIPVKLLDFTKQPPLTPQQKTVIVAGALDDDLGKMIFGKPGLLEVDVQPKTKGGTYETQPGEMDVPTTEPESDAIIPTDEKLKEVLGDEAKSRGKGGFTTPKETVATEVSVVGGHDGDEIVVSYHDGSVDKFEIENGKAGLGPSGLALDSVNTINFRAVKKPEAGAAVSVKLTPKLTKSASTVAPAATPGLSVTVPISGTTIGSTPLVAVGATSKPGDATKINLHLQRNRLYYNQLLWASLDAASLALLLSPYKYDSLPVLELIDPTPIGIVGNYLVFRMPVEVDLSGTSTNASQTKWTNWLKSHGFVQGTPGQLRTGVLTRQLVPLPSGGVFAEAVLGRSNSAEKLDLTRFWNWQDSPIPIQPPEITPVSTGSRTQPVDLKPGEFPAPMVNIVAPTTLPDPSGITAVLNAVSNGNMFRDMSGLAATVGLAQAAMQAASKQAGHAAAEATKGLEIGAEVFTELAKLAYSYVTGMPASDGPGKKNISNAGAAVNYGETLDKSESLESSVGGNGSAGANGSGSLSATTSVPSASGSHAEDAWRETIGGGPIPLKMLQDLFLTAADAGSPDAGGDAGIDAGTPDAGTPDAGTTGANLKVGDKVPAKSESAAVGAATTTIKRGDPAFATLVKNTNSDIVFKKEEVTDADQHMTSKLKDKLDVLATKVKAEWSGKKLRVTEAWDESSEHATNSTHYEGRAADITVDDQDTAKLGRLARLAVDAGLEWVWYENAAHVHVSVSK